MRSLRKELMAERLQSLAFWLAFGAFVTVLWVALPSRAADATVSRSAATQPPPYASSRIARTSVALVNGRGLRCTGS